MSDSNVIVMGDGSRWSPSTSREAVKCASCDNLVDTQEEILSSPSGNCPSCGNAWTGSEEKSIFIQVTVPEAMGGGAG